MMMQQPMNNVFAQRMAIGGGQPQMPQPQAQPQMPPQGMPPQGMPPQPGNMAMPMNRFALPAMAGQAPMQAQPVMQQPMQQPMQAPQNALRARMGY